MTAAEPKRDRLRRTWPQRFTFVTVIIAATTCFAIAAALATGQWVLSQRQLIALNGPTSNHDPSLGSSAIVVPGATTTVVPAGEIATATTIVLAEPAASNFLVAGSDNGACVGESSPTIGERSEIGERSDTIMVWRVNPETNQVAVLSLPRDLYVDVAGGRKARINSAYRRDDPTKLIDTIFLNFGIPIDHYIQVDFCAFEKLVDAVGGVAVPFDLPARDQASNLSIPAAGCINLDGQTALSYVRSRQYEFEDPAGSGNWTKDGTSDFGRIARQQDFLRRVVSKVIRDGLYSPSVASALIATNRDYLVTDSELTARKMLEFANTMRRLEPTEITTYRIESRSETRGGEQIEIPLIRGPNMTAILSVFRGEALLIDAPEQVFESDLTTTTTTTTTPTTNGTVPTTVSKALATTATSTSIATVSTTATSTSLPAVQAAENPLGVAPDRDTVCS
jgi:LCP family protein required for cell wall assembly